MPVREKMLLCIQNRTPITSQPISNISPSPIPPKIYYATAAEKDRPALPDYLNKIDAQTLFRIEQYLAFYETFSNLSNYVSSSSGHNNNDADTFQ